MHALRLNFVFRFIAMRSIVSVPMMASVSMSDLDCGDLRNEHAIAIEFRRLSHGAVRKMWQA